MLVTKGYEVRLYPNIEQQLFIDKTMGCYRFVYNQTLAEVKKAYEDTGHFSNPNTRINRLVSLKNEFPWLKEVEATALQQAVRDFNKAMDNYFKNRKHFGFPKFKTKRSAKQSYRSPYNGGRTDIYDIKHIKLPKIGLIATKPMTYLPEEYKLLNITITKTKTGKYYAKLCIQTEVIEFPKTNKVAGFDLGLTNLLISSDGSKIKPPKFARNSSDELVNAQRKLSKMRVKLEKAKVDLNKAKNYQKQKRKVAKIHEHIANQRKDFNHKLSKQLLEEYDLLAFEDLNVKGMIKNHKLAYAISDISWSQLLNFISYKAIWYGKQFIQVPRFYASSKICSVCGCYHADIVTDLSVRDWVCPDCGTYHDRDINAATNILNYALSM